MRISAIYANRSLRWPWRGVLSLTGCLACLAFVADGSTRAADRAAVVVAGDETLLLKRTAIDKPWQLAKDLDTLSDGAQVVGSVGAAIDSFNGGVRAILRGDIKGISPFPVLETSLTFRTAKDVDLAFEMDRGRVDLVNRKSSGAAKVRITIRGKSGEIVLPQPGDRLVVEMFGRWARGVRFTKTPKLTDAPALALVFVAVRGEPTVKGPEMTFALKAPPGQALLLFEDVADPSPLIEVLDSVPEWIDPKADDLQAKLLANVALFKTLAAKKSIGEALSEMSLSDDASARRGAVVLMGATDDLSRLAEAMATTKHADVWDNGVVVLRHWIGRGPGQDAKLYAALTEKAKIPAAEAEIIMQLFHSFGSDDLRKPELYQTLIDFLDNERLAIRGLAYWHLIRIVPQGKSIGYNPHGAKEAQAKAIKAWQALVPAGSLPGEIRNP